MTDTNNDNIYVIYDADGKTIIGTLEPGDVTSTLDLTKSGRNIMNVDTLSPENQNIFNNTIKDSKVIMDFINKKDYDGLKDYLNEQLEKMLDGKNDELLEKAQGIINDTDFKGVKDIKEFTERINQTLEDQNFLPLKDIGDNKSFMDQIKDALGSIDFDSTGMKIAYGVAGGILFSIIIALLIAQLAAKKEKEETEQRVESHKNKIIKNQKKKNGDKSIHSIGQATDVLSDNITDNEYSKY